MKIICEGSVTMSLLKSGCSLVRHTPLAYTLPMNTHDFNELTESIRQAGQIRRGHMQASRRFVLDEPDVAVIRHKYGMSQEAFASLMGIRVATLRNWEQGRRKPHGPAKVLLTIADRQPDAILAALT